MATETVRGSQRPDCVAEDAVRSEKVSRAALQFAIYREIFRNCTETRFIGCEI